MNKKEVTELVDRLSNNNPIMLGNILKKFQIKFGGKLDKEFQKKAEFIGDSIVDKWGRCDFTKSLQELIEESGWERTSCIDPDCPCGEFPLRNEECEYKTELKNPNTRNLLEFINSLELT